MTLSMPHSANLCNKQYSSCIIVYCPIYHCINQVPREFPFHYHISVFLQMRPSLQPCHTISHKGCHPRIVSWYLVFMLLFIVSWPGLPPRTFLMKVSHSCLSRMIKHLFSWKDNVNIYSNFSNPCLLYFPQQSLCLVIFILLYRC